MEKIFDTIIFDLGNVIFEIDPILTFKYWSKVSGMPLDLLLEFGKRDELLEDFEKANVSPKEYYDYITSCFNVKMSFDDFNIGFNQLFKDAYPDVAEEISQLYGHINIVALSNTNELHTVFWSKKYQNVLKYFDTLYTSSGLHMRKPDLKIYDYVLKNLDVSPDTVLYFDDLEENIRAARSLGITSYLVKKSSDVCDTIQSLKNNKEVIFTLNKHYKIANL